MNTEVKMSWLNSLGDLPHHLEYPEHSMWDQVRKVAEKYPDLAAYIFFGRKVRYRKFVEQVESYARSLRAVGVQPGDTVTIALPNCPQGVLLFYALNRIGAVSSMIHPLSAENEIEYFIKESGSRHAVTMDMFYGKFAAIRDRVELDNLLVVSIKDVVNPIVRAGYVLTEGRKIPDIPKDAGILTYRDFIAAGKTFSGELDTPRDCHDTSVILFSGGTTGVSKGIRLSSYNFNALAAQTLGANPRCVPGDKMLTVMPIFHGFGLGMSVHSILGNGGCCILVPRFTPQTYVAMLLKYRCNYIAGVPTLYEALVRMPEMLKANLYYLKGVYSGGDSLSVDLKKRIDRFLEEHNSPVPVREGYGTTECVTASCLTPEHNPREGSIGLPMPDMFYKIVAPGTDTELEYGKEGEICIAGPTVMLGYIGHEEENAKTLRLHSDGKTWLHTGDLGVMDPDGFVYFRQRLKRMIVTSGYNVYPSQLENVFDSSELVNISCAIGVPDPIKVQKVIMYVVLNKGVADDDSTRVILREYAKKSISKYAMPREIIFRDELPKTLVGKVNFRQLENEYLADHPEVRKFAIDIGEGDLLADPPKSTKV